MGIPLPALSIRPPEQQDLLGEAGKMMQLKSLMGAQQLQGLQTQEAQINLDNARQQQLESKTLRDAYRKNGGDLEKTISDAAASGNVSPGTLTKLQETHLKIQTDLASKDEKVLKNALDSGNLFAGALDAIKKVPIENRQQAVKTQLAQLANQGVDVSSVAKTVQGLPDLSDETLDGVEASLLGHNKAVEQEMKRREVAAQEQTATARADTAKTGKERLAAEMPGGALESPDKAVMQDWLAKNPGKGPADFARWKASLAPQAGIAAQGTPDAGLAAAVAGGQMKISDVITPRMPLPLRQQFLKQVLAINPNFKSSDFDIEKGVQKAFTSGPEAKNLTAFNTAIDHARQLDKAVDALRNSDVRGLNAVGNALGYQFGNDATTNFNVIKNALSGEISKVFKGGQATDAEIHAVQAPFDAANSPGQLKGAIKQAIYLMNSKRDALKKQYDQGSKAQPNFGEEKPPAASGLKIGDSVTIKGKQKKITAVHPDGSFDAQ